MIVGRELFFSVKGLSETMLFFILLVASIALVANAFLPALGSKWMIKSNAAAAVGAQTPLFAKEDLFSDDIFEDDEEEDTSSADSKKAEPAKSKRKYLEEDWKVSKEDSRDMTGIRSKTGEMVKASPDAKLPVFALMYKIRREYVDTSIDAVLADHQGCVDRYKRCLNSEAIRLGNSRGLVLLWIGRTESDKEQTRSDIIEFMEEDPLIVKDMIERWDIIDLTDKEDLGEEPLDRSKPRPAAAAAPEA